MRVVTFLIKQQLPVQVQCCFTSTETIRTIRDAEPRTSTSTVTQLLSSVIHVVQLNVAFTPERP